MRPVVSNTFSFPKYATARLNAFSQTGTINIHDHAGATELVQRHIYFNKERGEIPGFRIQIFSTNSLTSAKDAKASFLMQNEEEDASIVYEAPNYRLRVGNYSSRFDANLALQELIVQYPNAFIVNDMIKIDKQ